MLFSMAKFVRTGLVEVVTEGIDLVTAQTQWPAVYWSQTDEFEGRGRAVLNLSSAKRGSGCFGGRGVQARPHAK